MGLPANRDSLIRTDKEATIQLGRRLERDSARRAGGLIDPTDDHRRRSISDHLSDFLAHGPSSNRSARYRLQLEHRIQRIDSGSAPLLNLSTSAAQADFRSTVLQAIQDPILLPPPDGVPQPIFRPEGFFGTGRGDQLIPILINPNSALVKRGFARPGKYHFRRSALESWLKKNQRRR